MLALPSKHLYQLPPTTSIPTKSGANIIFHLDYCNSLLTDLSSKSAKTLPCKITNLKFCRALLYAYTNILALYMAFLLQKVN